MARKRFTCEAEILFAVIGGRWKLLILRELFAGPKRTGELRRAIAGITQKMLTQQLREMEAHGLVARAEFADEPRRHVEYQLTRLGKSVKPVVFAMHRWTLKHREELEPQFGPIRLS